MGFQGGEIQRAARVPYSFTRGAGGVPFAAR
jgi:hypothetical protein